jgi:hypothetical protein
MTALIELVCSRHTVPDPVGPLITRVDGVWAYCEGHAESAHSWSRVQPTRREDLGDMPELQGRRAS